MSLARRTHHRLRRGRRGAFRSSLRQEPLTQQKRALTLVLQSPPYTSASTAVPEIPRNVLSALADGETPDAQATGGKPLPQGAVGKARSWQRVCKVVSRAVASARLIGLKLNLAVNAAGWRATQDEGARSRGRASMRLRPIGEGARAMPSLSCCK